MVGREVGVVAVGPSEADEVIEFDVEEDET